MLAKARNRRAISAGFLLDGCHGLRDAVHARRMFFVFRTRVKAHSTHIVVS